MNQSSESAAKYQVNISKPRVLVISHALPFPKTSGQNMRVYYILLALRQFFDVTFITSRTFLDQSTDEEKLSGICDDVIIMPSVYKNGIVNRAIIKLSGFVFTLISGLKFSNYLTGYIEFSPKRLRKAIENRSFNIVLFEYWHAYKSVSVFKSSNTPCVLDMHNILVQSHKVHFDKKISSFIKKIQVRKYQKAEENSWKSFDAVIAINRKEYEFVANSVPASIKLFYIAMGIDLEIWPYVWQPVKPQRLAYYGGMASYHNKQNALFCVRQVMPLIWQKYPDTEFWIIGSDPDDELLSLEKDSRIHVTGYQNKVQNTLKHISVLLCPWQGKYGFRSRIIEIMATGVPVIASKDAVDGMDLLENKGLFFAEDESAFESVALTLLNNQELLSDQSRKSRSQIENLYSFEATYLKGIKKISDWVLNK